MTRKILVADDSTTIQKVIKIAFSRYAIEINEATSYIEALAIVARAAPELLIVDASLPGAQGPSDVAKLAKDAGGRPVLLLVGTYEAVDEDLYRKAGFQHFLKKPFESADIIALVDELLGGSLGEVTSGVGRPAAPDVPPGRSQHATVIMEGGMFPARGTFDPTRPPPVASESTNPSGAGEGDDAHRVPPPPPPAGIVDQARKGRKAFGDEERSGASRAAADARTPPPPPPAGAPSGGSNAVTPLPPIPPSLGTGLGALEEGAGEFVPISTGTARAATRGGSLGGGLDDEQLGAWVRQAVEDYCARHFKSLAREIIASELRRLADEKARHLVDG
jgi:CheY-like chemotaxis protein